MINYSTKGVNLISMASGNSKKVEDYWQFSWYLTSPRPTEQKINHLKMWSVITLDTTYGLLKDVYQYNNYLSCVKELIRLVKPFHAGIDDVSNWNALMEKVNEDCYTPKYIQQIFWGNYFGETHCAKYGMKELLSLPADSLEVINGGVLFFLTGNIFDFASKECDLKRKTVKKYLKNIKIK